MAPGGGPNIREMTPPEFAQMSNKEQAAKKSSYQDTVYQLETSGGKTKSQHLGGAANKYQFTQQARSRYQPRGSDWNDPHVQDQTLINESADNRNLLRGSLGREPEDQELYLAHQQGFHGANQMLRFPDQSPSELGINPKSFGGNVPSGKNPAQLFNSPSKNFTGMWKQRWDRAQQQLQSSPNLRVPIGTGDAPDEVGARGFGDVKSKAEQEQQDDIETAMQRIGGIDDPLMSSTGNVKVPGDTVTRQAPGHDKDLDQDMPIIEDKIGEEFRSPASGLAPQGSGFRDISGAASDIQDASQFSVYRIIDNAAGGDSRAASLTKAIFEGESNHTRGQYDSNMQGENSQGPFQLNKNGGLGAVFHRQTGLDPANPNTVAQQAKFITNYLQTHNYDTSPWRGFQHGVQRIERGQVHPNDNAFSMSVGTGDPIGSGPAMMGAMIAGPGPHEKALQEKQAGTAGAREDLDKSLNAPVPRAPQPPDIVGYTRNWQRQQNQQTLSGAAPIFKGLLMAAIIGGLALSRRSYGPSAIMVGGLSGLLGGMNEGDKRRAQKGLDDYNMGLEAMTKQYTMEREAYHDILNERDMDISTKEARLKALAAEYDDKELAKSLDNKDYAAADKLMANREANLQKAADAHRHAEDLHNKYVYDDESKRRGDKAKTKELDEANKAYDGANKDLLKAQQELASQNIKRLANGQAEVKAENSEAIKTALANLQRTKQRKDAAMAASSGSPIPPSGGGEGGAVGGGGFQGSAEEKSKELGNAKYAIDHGIDKDAVMEKLNEKGLTQDDLDDYSSETQE
jgi:hypothetical protein